MRFLPGLWKLYLENLGKQPEYIGFLPILLSSIRSPIRPVPLEIPSLPRGFLQQSSHAGLSRNLMAATVTPTGHCLGARPIPGTFATPFNPLPNPARNCDRLDFTDKKTEAHST